MNTSEGRKTAKNVPESHVESTVCLLLGYQCNVKVINTERQYYFFSVWRRDKVVLSLVLPDTTVWRHWGMEVYLQVFLTGGVSESGWSAIRPNFLGERAPVPTEWESKWARNPVSTPYRGGTPRHPLEIEPTRRQAFNLSLYCCGHRFRLVVRGGGERSAWVFF